MVVVPPGADQAHAAVRQFNEMQRQGLTPKIVSRGRVLSDYIASILPFGGRRNGCTTYFRYTSHLWGSILRSPPKMLDEFTVDLWEFRRQVVRFAVQWDGHLIVLLGQQLPVEFYELLRLLNISTTVYVDANAEVQQNGSTISEVMHTMRVDQPTVLLESATTATVQDFVDDLSDNPHGYACRRPAREGPRPRLCHHTSIVSEAGFVRCYAAKYPQRRIGLVVPTTDLVIAFRNCLADSEMSVQSYVSGEWGGRLEIRKAGVKILTWQSAGGLEFDTVVVAGLHYGLMGGQSGLSSALQMLAATAKRDLVLSYSGDGVPTFLAALPQHALDVQTVDAPPEPAPDPGPPITVTPGPIAWREELAPDTRAERSATDRARAVIAADRHDPGRRRRVLTAEEEVGLVSLIRGDEFGPDTELPKRFRTTLDANDERARAFDAMVMHNDRLVASLVGRMRGTGVEDDDLHQFGVKGLIRAVEMFKPSMGTKFSTYATNWIKQSIGRGVADTGTLIRVPVHVHEMIRRVLTARQQLVSRHGTASVSVISRLTGIAPAKVVDCLRLSAGVLSLDTPLTNEPDLTLADLVPAVQAETTEPDQILDRRAGVELVRRALAQLPPREAEVLRLRYGLDGDDGLTLDEIGRTFEVSRERIRQIEVRAKQRLTAELARLGLFGAEAPTNEPTDAGASTVRDPDPTTNIVRSRTDIASGSDLRAAFGVAWSPAGPAGLIRQLVRHSVHAQAHQVSIRTGRRDGVSWLAVAHDGGSVLEDVIRATLAGSTDTPVRPDIARGTAWRAVGTALGLFDEIVSWRRLPADEGPECLVLANSRHTGAWWLYEARGLPPRLLTTDLTTSWHSVTVLRSSRQDRVVAGLRAAVDDSGHELAMVFGELLRAGQLRLTLNERVITWRDPFLRRNPRSQDLGVERVSAGGHSAEVSPRILPHPTALSAEDRESVGDPAEWVRQQGFYVRCAGEYVSWHGWLGLDRLDCAPGTALARVIVDIEPTELGAWGLGDDGAAGSPPEPLRIRLAALAALARSRSELVLARQPLTGSHAKE